MAAKKSMAMRKMKAQLQKIPSVLPEDGGDVVEDPPFAADNNSDTQSDIQKRVSFSLEISLEEEKKTDVVADTIDKIRSLRLEREQLSQLEDIIIEQRISRRFSVSTSPKSAGVIYK